MHLKYQPVIYKSVRSAELPIPHDENIPVPEPVEIPNPSLGFSDFTSESAYSPDESEPSTSKTKAKQPILITQPMLNNIAAKLWLGKVKSEMLASWLKSNNLLAPGTRVTAFRNRQKDLQQCFTVARENTFAFCDNIELLMKKMDITYVAYWRLFIDSSSNSLKAVLLHKDNKLPTIPVAYSTKTSENHEIMSEILKRAEYKKHEWRICCDLKVVAILAGMQQGYTKNMCFMCLWDSRHEMEDKAKQYKKHDWAPRQTHTVGQKNISREALVPKTKILLPCLHLWLGICMSFIKNIAKRDAVFLCLRIIFPKTKVSDDKLRKGINS